ncbi:hypothetical protein QSU92_01165 [Microbacterium sp. ET2]|uniref:hypothetical protein n=1 Tax=Microbacterium albipurpureum TaxID=3050384 RepID=UPI00259D1878|nr:hypothetical protein [Microbacterium sp. ET2 (Ac-2212)]WJL95866.1 hypothetical protein QSU92_01165 [Microbacterium sp. ET2 (Ac-2212)]
MYLQNEDKHLDLAEWLDTLEQLGIDITTAFPAVADANQRVDRLEKIRSEHISTHRDITTIARQLGTADNLDDTTAVLTVADHFAYSQSDEHRQRVTEILEQAADFAKGDAIRRFRHANILAAIRPRFDALAARITEAEHALPGGVLNLDDAARLAHADTWMQLERDIATWNTLAGLLNDLVTARVLQHPATGDQPASGIDFLIEDYDAFDDTLAGRGSVRAMAAAITAGRPRLLTPDEITPRSAVQPLTHDQQARRTWEANERDRAARAALPIPA